MRAVKAFLVMAALTGAASGLFERYFHFYSDSRTWSDAQAFCRRTHVDLGPDDSNPIFHMFSDRASDKYWIGLRRNAADSRFSRWSDGSTVWFTRWNDSVSLTNDSCVYIHNNVWSTASCSLSFKFNCYDWYPYVVVVQEMKTWHQALEHCRTHYKDLISVSAWYELEWIKNRSSAVQTPTFWTGLRFVDGSWFFSNNETFLEPVVMPSCPKRPQHCGARNVRADTWETRDCDEKMNFLCYHD